MAPALAGRLGLGLAPGSARVWAQPAFARKAINLDAWLTATRFDASGPPPGVKPGPSAPAAGAGMGRTLRQAGAAEPGGAQQGGGVSSLAGRSDGAGLEACVVGGSCAEPFTQPLNRSFTLLPGTVCRDSRLPTLCAGPKSAAVLQRCEGSLHRLYSQACTVALLCWCSCLSQRAAQLGSASLRLNTRRTFPIVMHAGGQWVNRAPLRSLARVHLLQGNTRGFTNQQLDALFRLLGQFW